MDPSIPQDFSFHLVSRLGSLVDHSLYHANYFYVPGNLALQEALCCVSKLAGALFLWLSSRSSMNGPGKFNGNSNHSKSRSIRPTQLKRAISSKQNLAALNFDYTSNSEKFSPAVVAKVACSTLRQILSEIGHLHSFSTLSLAAAFVPPLGSVSSDVLAIPLNSSTEKTRRYLDQAPCEAGFRNCSTFALSEINWASDPVEPQTGIRFPSFLDNSLGIGDNTKQITEVLVGTGSRSMRIVKVKSLTLYAFGLYIHPDSVCKKLGPKYSSVPVSELKDRPDFFDSLLREDIHMTVRLVVSCNGIKINAVKEAFEKSLRTRLQKMNPGTDYHCLNAFGSYFTRDIPLPQGTTIEFRKTADWQLITQIGGQHIGAVRSKDLCRAFFDMYVGDSPVSLQTKQDIAQNVAGLIKGC